MTDADQRSRTGVSNRRKFLGIVGIAGAMTIAGCLDDDEPDDADGVDDADDPTIPDDTDDDMVDDDTDDDLVDDDDTDDDLVDDDDTDDDLVDDDDTDDDLVDDDDTDDDLVDDDDTDDDLDDDDTDDDMVDDDEEEDTYTLSIGVENEDGDPVEGATVWIEDDLGTVGGVFEDEDEGETDADGIAYAELMDGEYTVYAEHDDYGEGYEEVEIAGEDEEVVITLEEGDDDDL